MDDDKTYEMEFICSNCGTKFVVKIEMGTEARGRGGTCPYCGKQDRYYDHFWYQKPVPLAEEKRMNNEKESGYEYDVAICMDTIKAIRFFFVGGYNVIVPKDTLYSLLFSCRKKSAEGKGEGSSRG